MSDTQYYPNPNADQPSLITYNGVRSSRDAANYSATIGTPLGGHAPYTQVLIPNGSGLTAFNRGNQVPTFLNSSFGNTGDGFSARTLSNAQAPNNRKILDALINYKIAEDVGRINDINFFADFKYADSRGGPYANDFTRALTSTDANIPIPVSNAYTPPDLARQLVGYTGSVTGGIPGILTPGLSAGYNGASYNIRKITADWGLRTSQYEYEYFRSVVGFNGTMFDKFKYEVYYNYGQNVTQFINSDRLSANLLNALDSVVGPTGQIICRSALTNPGNGCVPINPFRVGALTPAQAAYVNVLTHENDELTQQNVVANVTGNLFSYATPFSGTVAPLGIALGAEYREEGTNSQPDALQLQPTGTIAGNSAGNGYTIGKFHTREAYGEVSIPILRDLTLVKALDLDAAFRYQSFSTTGDDFTWNTRLTWAVTDDFKFRGGFAKAVRAPNGDELYSNGGQSFTSFEDPCGGDNGKNRNTPARIANCAGIPLYTNSPFTSSQILGGNPNLRVETSQNAQIGGVFTPTFLPRFSASADYYTFVIKNVITTLDPGSELTATYDSGSSQYANFITRNSDGSLNTVATPYVNAGRQVLKGVDFGMAYLIPLSDYGYSFTGQDSFLNLTYDMSWIINNKITVPISGSTYRLNGQLGFPRVKFVVKGTYTEGPVSFTAATRYFGEQNLNVVDDVQTFDHNLVAPQVYQDLYISYAWRNLKFFGGCQNLFDVRPSQLPTAFNGGNYPATNSNLVQSGQAYGTLDNTGRYLFAGVTAKF